MTTTLGIILECSLMADNVATTTRACKKWALWASMQQAFAIEEWLRHDPRGGTFAELAGRVEGLKRMILDEATFRFFLVIPDHLSQYVEKERALGDRVYDAFPSARGDLSEAGNCLACGRNTAAAFHLMRAAEIGLKELGRDRQIPLAKNYKIAFEQWGTIIGELEIAIKAVQQWPKSPTKEEAHKFYNSALVEIRAFNDGWRRRTAHVHPHQPPMNSEEARALWGHVERFLATLATKISEGSYTPLVW